MTGKDYSELDICGDTAGPEWQRVTFTKTAKNEKEKVRKELLKYCEQDTQSMIEVLNELKREVD